MKKLCTEKITLNELIEKINNYQNESRVSIIYFDVLPKNALEDKELIKMIQDNDSLLVKEDSNTIFFLRDCPIVVYRGMLEAINKYKNQSLKSINKLVPQSLIDFNRNIEYTADEKEIEQNISIF